MTRKVAPYWIHKELRWWAVDGVTLTESDYYYEDFAYDLEIERLAAFTTFESAIDYVSRLYGSAPHGAWR